MSSNMAAEAEDALRFQRWIRKIQYPHDCGSTIGVLTRAGQQANGDHYAGNYFYGLGLGSQMASLKYNFVHALLRNRVYHFPTSHYVNPVRCATQTFDCYFAAPTNCSRTLASEAVLNGSSTASARVKHRSIETAQLLWCFEVPRRRLSRLAGLAAVHSEAWYQGQLAAFLFRPNGALSAFMASLKPRLAYDVNHSRAAALAGTPGGLHAASCVAMHVRRTDKFRGRRREDSRSQVDFSGFARAYRFWAHWFATRPAGGGGGGDGMPRVLLGSEDPATFRVMPALLAPTVAYWIPGHAFVR